MPSPLQGHAKRYRKLATELATELATLGFISPGSLVVRHTSAARLAAAARPTRRNGPYYQWSRAVAGKTVSRRLNEPRAERYRDWIANRQRIETILTKMEETSAAAAELLLHEQRTADQ